jgi:probable rRNA maturation factor
MILFDTELSSDSGSDRRSARPAVIPRNDRVPSARTLTRFLSEARAAVRLRGQVTVLLTSDAAIRRLNRQFRGKNKATDVLSFPALEMVEGVAGDLAISVDTARRQAREQGHALGVEIKVLMLHGLLHLAGYDHETDSGEMAKRERLLRGRLGLPQGLIERVSHVSKPRHGRPAGTKGLRDQGTKKTKASVSHARKHGRGAPNIAEAQS